MPGETFAFSARNPARGQFFTPTWTAELLLRRAFPSLGPDDLVLDPTCGDGRFLMAVPDGVRAIGVETDPDVAAEARLNSGRQVLTGDFLQIEIPDRPTAIIGNPPYRSQLITDILTRCYELLEYERGAAFLLPVYFLQTASTVAQLARRWSISQELVPRNLFVRLEKPLAFVQFRKSRRCVVSGFLLYSEVDAVQSLRREFREMFIGNNSRASVWREVVYAALRVCGGRATLQQLYACIEDKRPTENRFWREKIRQIAGMHFIRVADGEYALPGST